MKGQDGVVLCKSNNNTIDQRYNDNKSTPRLLDQANPNVGLSNSNVTMSDGLLSCSFTRTISNPNIQNYFDLNTNYYILAAFGPISNGKLYFY